MILHYKLVFLKRSVCKNPSSFPFDTLHLMRNSRRLNQGKVSRHSIERLFKAYLQPLFHSVSDQIINVPLLFTLFQNNMPIFISWYDSSVVLTCWTDSSVRSVLIKRARNAKLKCWCWYEMADLFIRNVVTDIRNRYSSNSGIVYLQLGFAFPATSPDRKIICDLSIEFRLFAFQSEENKIKITWLDDAVENRKLTHRQKSY